MPPQKMTNQQLSLADKLDVVPALAIIISVGFVSMFTGLTRSQKDAPTLRLHIAYAILRKASQRLSPLQLQWISPMTDVVYEQYARSARVRPVTVVLGHGAKGHWIGDTNSQTVLIWYHGGGFCVPANIAYFKFLEHLVKTSGSAGKSLAVFALTYSLAPHEQYPTQLIQAVEALRYILKKPRRHPAQILLGGDSAGGNLAIGVLSHLAHPHPAIAELKVTEPLAGACLISPWTSLDERHSESKTYYGGDLIMPCVGKPWSRAYLGIVVRDYYTDPSDAPPKWFQNFPVNKILVLGGQNEVLLSNIQDFVETLKVRKVPFRCSPAALTLGCTGRIPFRGVFIGKREAHVAPVYNMYFGDKTETEQGKKLVEWIRELL